MEGALGSARRGDGQGRLNGDARGMGRFGRARIGYLPGSIVGPIALFTTGCPTHKAEDSLAAPPERATARPQGRPEPAPPTRRPPRAGMVCGAPRGSSPRAAAAVRRSAHRRRGAPRHAHAPGRLLHRSAPVPRRARRDSEVERDARRGATWPSARPRASASAPSSNGSARAKARSNTIVRIAAANTTAARRAAPASPIELAASASERGASVAMQERLRRPRDARRDSWEWTASAWKRGGTPRADLGVLRGGNARGGRRARRALREGAIGRPASQKSPTMGFLLLGAGAAKRAPR